MSPRRPDRPPTARALATLLAVAAAPVGVLVSRALVDLPERLAVHWDARAADATLPTDGLLAAALVAGTAAVAVVAVALTMPGAPFLARRFAVRMAAAVGGFAAGLWGLLVVTAASAPVPGAPAPPDLEVLVPLVAVLLATGLAGAAYGEPATDPDPPAPAAGLPRADLPGGGPPRWAYESWSGFFLVCVGALLVLGALLYRTVALGAVLAWVMAVLTLLPARLRLTVDARGLSVQAWGRGPAGTVPWSRIVDARAALVRPLQWGGWGFRVIPARAGVVTRKGPGLVLTLTDGRRLGVTLPDPLLPAGLVNAYLDRLRTGPPG